MASEIRVESSDIPDADWDKRVLEANGFVYQTTGYAEYIKETLGMKLLFLIARDSSGKILGQMAVHYGPLFSKYLKDRHKILYKIFSKFFKVYYCVKGPVIFDQSDLTLKKAIYEKFIDYLDDLGKKAYMIQDFSLPIGEDEGIYEIFKRRGFYSDSWGTVIVDTTKSVDENDKNGLWMNLGKTRRYDVRQGSNQSLFVKEARSKEEYEKVISIIEDMSKRNKVFAHPRTYYYKLFGVLGKKNLIKTFFIEKDGNGVATISVYLFGKRAIQTLVAHTEYSIKEKIFGTDFLEWWLIKWCHDNGYETYDLAGIRPESKNRKDISLMEYKMRWVGKDVLKGGWVVRYPYFSKTYSKTKTKIANLMRKIYKRDKGKSIGK